MSACSPANSRSRRLPPTRRSGIARAARVLRPSAWTCPPRNVTVSPRARAGSPGRPGQPRHSVPPPVSPSSPSPSTPPACDRRRDPVARAHRRPGPASRRRPRAPAGREPPRSDVGPERDRRRRRPRRSERRERDRPPPGRSATTNAVRSPRLQRGWRWAGPAIWSASLDDRHLRLHRVPCLAHSGGDLAELEPAWERANDVGCSRQADVVATYRVEQPLATERTRYIVETVLDDTLLGSRPGCATQTETSSGSTTSQKRRSRSE